ncbi:MAG: hypothetical protein RIM83_18120 [Allomuricauda sp.]|jgi:hypothetical protein|uniref:hypothetical protein n=1 Tax=Allomuricauda sp. CP2A TaxID=1848189 RepID=UPI000831203E|nr:hypothetical protein [Muricauda sp. CP2A]
MSSLKKIGSVTAESIDNSQEYLKHSWEYYKLKLFMHTAELSIGSVKLVFFSILGMMALGLFSIALAIYLGDVLENLALGYVLTGALYILLMFVAYALFRKKIEKRIIKKLSKTILRDE